MDALVTGGFLQKQKIGRGNYYVNLALSAVLQIVLERKRNQVVTPTKGWARGTPLHLARNDGAWRQIGVHHDVLPTEVRLNIDQAILDDVLPYHLTLFDIAVDPPAVWGEQRV